MSRSKTARGKERVIHYRDIIYFVVDSWALLVALVNSSLINSILLPGRVSALQYSQTQMSAECSVELEALSCKKKNIGVLKIKIKY